MNTEMISEAGQWFIALLILFGAVTNLISAFGLVRLPDAYLRSHAATKSATLGVLCILTGAFLYFIFFLDELNMKLILCIVFVFITSPVAGHLNGRAAYRTGVAFWEKSIRKDLKVKE